MAVFDPLYEVAKVGRIEVDKHVAIPYLEVFTMEAADDVTYFIVIEQGLILTHDDGFFTMRQKYSRPANRSYRIGKRSCAKRKTIDSCQRQQNRASELQAPKSESLMFKKAD